MRKFLALFILVIVFCFSMTIVISAGVVPDVLFTFQNPSYIIDKNSLLTEFTCDITKSDCKINFDLSTSFTGGFSELDYTCSLDFGMGNLTGEEAKCNPNTVIFTGSIDYTIRFKIIQKTDSNIFSEKTLIIHSGYTPPVVLVNTSSGVSNNTGTLSNSGTLTNTGILIDSGSLTNSGIFNNTGALVDSGILANSGILNQTGLLVSTGNISLLTSTSVLLSGVIFDPITLTGMVYYGMGELVSSGNIFSGSFTFSPLISNTDYVYRIGYLAYSGAIETLSATGVFHTLSLPKLTPDIVFVFQNPSYVIDKNTLLSEFTCDNTQSDCKVNLDFSSSFTGGFSASNYTCLLDFGMGNLTGEESKCNPNTIIFTGSSDYIVHVKIIQKTNPSIFSERTIIFHSGNVIVTTSSGALSSSEVLSGSGILDNSGVLVNTGIISDTGSISTSSLFIIADPEIVIQSGLDSSLRCTKTDCIVNLEYIPKDSKERCLWDFSGGTYSSGTEQSCNPGYIHYPIGLFSFTLRVYEVGNISNYREKILSFSNSISIVSSGAGSSSYSIPMITISDPNIIIQSGLDSSNHCTKSDCSLNLEYKVLGPKEACYWDFPGGSFTAGTENQCNPGYIHYPIGEFSVTLRVFEQGNIFNYREKNLHFSNGNISEIQEAKVNPGNHPPVALIKLQGTLGKTKIQQGNSIKCVEMDECNINFSGEESYDLGHDIMSYYWDFGNGKTSDKENPPSMKYGTGEYSVLLRVTDKKGFSNEQYFKVSVLGKDAKKEKKSIDENVFSLKIVSVSPNPFGSDNFTEWTEIINPLGVDISLAGCVLDDDKEKGSDSYIFGDSTLIRANSSKRFYKLQTLLNFNNTSDSVNLSCSGEIISSISWDYSVPEGFIVSGEYGLLQQKDENIFSDFLQLAAEDDTISSEILSTIVFENLFVFDDVGMKMSVLKSKKTSKNLEIKSLEDIHISLQGIISKNRTLTGNILTCHTKSTCSVNLTAGNIQKDTIYIWDFGDDKDIYGANPPAHIFSVGKHKITLKIYNLKTGGIREEIFSVIVKKLVTTKKTKIPKIIPPKVEKPLVIKGQNFYTPPTLEKQEFSQLKASASIGIIISLVFSGIYVLIRRKKIYL